jgi:benzoate/toluate 1,2-dioxygenase subunit alpha
VTLRAPTADISRYVDDRPREGVFRVSAEAFSDPQLLELELELVFERTWSFLGIESQLTQANDFLTTWIGRVPVLVTRDTAGGIHGMLNICRHKGALLCRKERGNARYHVCQYHGWAYQASGKNASVKDRDAGRYARAFDGEGHDLIALPRIAVYRGMIFGSLHADVPPLEEYLGGVRAYIDLAMDQGANGMEIIPGRTVYAYAGNWKLQLDNGLDHYHLNSTHTSFLEVQSRRAGQDTTRGLRQYDWQKRELQEAGAQQFAHGHAAVWMNQPEPERRPIYPRIGEVRARVGEEQADWMLRLRNALVFPNLQIAESTTLLLRTFRPLAVDKTEMRVFCLAPIGEPAELRAWRIRQYEDFFNPSGLATPDDTALYADCQAGFDARRGQWLQGYARGLDALTADRSEIGGPPQAVALAGVRGSFKIQNEVCFHPPWREWARLLRAGAAGANPYDGQSTQLGAGDFAQRRSSG